MERYPKLFILAAVGYLLAGVALGLYVGISASPPYVTRFIHVHFNLLGFMAMFIYGVAYHILPRFNAKPIKRPELVAVHFYLANLGLLGMSGFAIFDGLYGTGPAHYGFVISSIVEAAGIIIFAYNIMPVMLLESSREESRPRITGDMKAAEVLDKWPQLTKIFEESGFKALTSPAARATFAKAVIISQACKLHKVNEREFLEKLNSALESGATDAPSLKKPTTEQRAAKAMAKGKKISRGQQAEADTLIGSVLEVYPETREVFEKHYGEGCISCAGQAFETISETAMMHGLKTETILGEINEIIESAKQED